MHRAASDRALASSSPTPARSPDDPETRRSSAACNASINAAWRPRRATKASTNGRSCLAWTKDSPASPMSLERLSAETRTTRPDASTAEGMAGAGAGSSSNARREG